MSTWEIRPYRPEDTPGLTDVLRQCLPAFVFSEAAVAHWYETVPAAAKLAAWVALSENRVVGAGEGLLYWQTSKEGLSEVAVWVLEEHRSQGLGGELYDLAFGHLKDVGAEEVLSNAMDGSAGEAFLRKRGFSPGSVERLSSLDPRTVDLSELEERRRRALEQGYRLVTLAEAEVLGDVEDLFACYAEALADTPGDVTFDRLDFDDWRRRNLSDPDLERQGSFVVLGPDGVASLAFIDADPVSRRAANSFTATRRAHRHRGLGRLVKLATIDWAVREGYDEIITGNDSTNADMLTLNEHLGYRPLYNWRSFCRKS